MARRVAVVKGLVFACFLRVVGDGCLGCGAWVGERGDDGGEKESGDAAVGLRSLCTGSGVVERDGAVAGIVSKAWSVS